MAGLMSELWKRWARYERQLIERRPMLGTYAVLAVYTLMITAALVPAQAVIILAILYLSQP